MHISNDTIFKNKNFILLWLGQLVSILGSNFHSLAVMWYVLEITGSAAKAGITMVFTVVPQILLSPLTGPIADRFNRKVIIVVSDLINGILVGIIAILCYTNNLQLWTLYLISAFMSASSAFFSPALLASIPTIVKKENLVKANSLSQIVRYSSSILGPALGGILVVLIGIPGLFLLNSISFLLSSFSESFIKITYVAKSKIQKMTLLKDFQEGISYSVKNKDLLQIIIVGGIIINFLYAPLSLIIAVVAKDNLNSGSEGYGILLGALSVGGLLMSFIIPKISKKTGNFKLLFIGLTLEGLLLLPFAFINSLSTGIMSLLILGCSFGIVNVTLGTVIQTIVPNDVLGRVSSVMNILCTLTVPLGYYLGGIALENFKTSEICIVIGIITAISGFSTIRIIKHETLENINDDIKTENDDICETIS
ncbi:permease [Vallitalea longa]|uniref:Permease n=1 Tax=Vallitalea longa TaxID=2936439 RepID=A0A9W5YD75_9FIRM|nr:MFS transporter [Vallitalea longa]GKX30914.1 permease [Vallitalea longa]